MGIGLLVFLLSWRFLYHFTETTGQVGCLSLPVCLPSPALPYVRLSPACTRDSTPPPSTPLPRFRRSWGAC